MPHDAELLNSPKNKTVDFYDKYAQGSAIYNAIELLIRRLEWFSELPLLV